MSHIKAFYFVRVRFNNKKTSKTKNACVEGWNENVYESKDMRLKKA